MRFVKKPIPVEASQWFKNGDHPKDDCYRHFENTGLIPTEPMEGKIVRFFRHPYQCGGNRCHVCDHLIHDHGWIDTLEGGHIVCPGDWIITGVFGERYPCKPKIFESTYVPFEEYDLLKTSDGDTA